MTVFEFVYGFMSIVTSLAVTHTLAGFVALARNANRVRFSLVHALWAWSAFATTIGNWAASWESRTLPSWPAWTVLLTLVNSIGQYVACAFVTPELREGVSIDLVEFHRSKGVFYLAAFFVLGLLAIAFNVTFGLEHYYSQWVRDTLLTLPLLALLVVAIFIRVGWVQMACAAIQGVLSTYFLIVAINIAP
jgi:hypothetical protein